MRPNWGSPVRRCRVRAALPSLTENGTSPVPSILPASSSPSHALPPAHRHYPWTCAVTVPCHAPSTPAREPGLGNAVHRRGQASASLFDVRHGGCFPGAITGLRFPEALSQPGRPQHFRRPEHRHSAQPIMMRGGRLVDCRMLRQPKVARQPLQLDQSIAFAKVGRQGEPNRLAGDVDFATCSSPPVENDLGARISADTGPAQALAPVVEHIPSGRCVTSPPAVTTRGW